MIIDKDGILKLPGDKRAYVTRYFCKQCGWTVQDLLRPKHIRALVMCPECEKWDVTIITEGMLVDDGCVVIVEEY